MKFSILQKAGLAECPHQPHRNKPILAGVGLMQAFKPHQELIIKKQNRQTK